LHPAFTFKIIATILIICLTAPSAFGFFAGSNITLITAESYNQPLVLEGSIDNPIIIAPPPKINFSANTQKLIVVPQKLVLKEEIEEFTMFRNRYVIFGCYLFAALYYNWLTRYR